MDFITIAKEMYPFWIMGLLIVFAVLVKGRKHILRIEKKPLLKCLAFLTVVTLYRILMYKYLPGFKEISSSAKNVTILPWTISFTVFWEDACHGLPLFLLRELIGTHKWAKAINTTALGLAMVVFGLGHLYQGVMAAVFLSFYIPYSLKYGTKYGFGTVMLCHILYDLVTLLFAKYAFGM